MSTAQKIISGLQQLVVDLREGKPLTVTKVIRKGKKFRLIKGRTDKPYDVKVIEIENDN